MRPSPVVPTAEVHGRYNWVAPPVASTTAPAAKVSSWPLLCPRATAPVHAPPSWISDVTNHSLKQGMSSLWNCSCSTWSTMCPVRSSAYAARWTLLEPNPRRSIRPSASRLKGTPTRSSQMTSRAASVAMIFTASVSHRPSPALLISWANFSAESSLPRGAFRPPGDSAELVRSGWTLLSTATDAPARLAAMAARRPEAPPPITRTSNCGNGDPLFFGERHANSLRFQAV